MTLGNIFLVKLTSDLLQCTMNFLTFLWCDVFDVKKIHFYGLFTCAVVLRF